MPKRLSELVIVVTGASSGIGKATALEIASRKGTVVLASRQSEALDELVAECEHMGGRALAIQTDVGVEEQVQNLARRAIETFGRIDVWVNDASVALYSKFEDTPTEVFKKVIETNLFGCIHGARAVLPSFREQGEGVIINLSAAFGKVGAPYLTAYATSKFAINGFSESLRMELRNEPHIHVCTILPGTVDTPLFQHAANFTGRFVQALPPVYKAEQVVEAILNCITNPKPEVFIGRSAKQMALLQKLSTPLAESYVAAKVEKKHFLDNPVDNSEGNVFAAMTEHNTISGGWMETDRGASKAIAAVATMLLAGAGLAFYKYRTQKRSSMARLAEATA